MDPAESLNASLLMANTSGGPRTTLQQEALTETSPVGSPNRDQTRPDGGPGRERLSASSPPGGAGSPLQQSVCPSAAAVMSSLLAAAAVPVVAVVLFVVRFYVVVKTRPNLRRGAAGPVSVLVVAGSGGHTTELLRLLGSVSAAYTPRHYVIADTDRMSEDKICSFENRNHPSEPQFSIDRIPRSREVQQSWTSSVASTLSAFWFCLPLVFRLKPDLVLCNGPGTCVPPCVAALLLGIMGVKKVVLVYVESVCRVRTLSLTGRILYPLSDHFLVQWAPLRDRYPGAVFLGRVV